MEGANHIKGVVSAMGDPFFIHKEEVSSMIPLWFENLTKKMNGREVLKDGLPYMIRISGKTHEYLYNVFQRYLGKTPTEYFNELRLNYARNLLLNTDMTVMEIAAEIGLENLSYFYHIFKKRFGESPVRMRKNCQKHMIP